MYLDSRYIIYRIVSNEIEQIWCNNIDSLFRMEKGRDGGIKREGEGGTEEGGRSLGRKGREREKLQATHDTQTYFPHVK